MWGEGSLRENYSPDDGNGLVFYTLSVVRECLESVFYDDVNVCLRVSWSGRLESGLATTPRSSKQRPGKRGNRQVLVSQLTRVASIHVLFIFYAVSL